MERLLLKSRAYRHPVSVAETASRVARSITEHRAQGVYRTVEEYVQSHDVAEAVYALLAKKKNPCG